VTHDPLCPREHPLASLHENCDGGICEEWRCQCDLIKILREIYSQKIDFITRLAYDAGYDEGLAARHDDADTAPNIGPPPPEGPEAA
jgi:hypothetical protein